MSTPWDIYVDERKVPGDSAIGFLIVPNTSSFSHKLFRCSHHPPSRDGRTIELSMIAGVKNDDTDL